LIDSRSKSTLFLIEQLIVVAVFAICSAACVRIMTFAFFTAQDSRDVKNAILVAELGCESYKAVSGDIGKVAEILGGKRDSVDGADAVVVYYDRQWQVCAEDNANYALRLVNKKPSLASSYLIIGELSVEKSTGEGLIAFELAVNDSR